MAKQEMAQKWKWPNEIGFVVAINTRFEIEEIGIAQDQTGHARNVYSAIFYYREMREKNDSHFPVAHTCSRMESRSRR